MSLKIMQSYANKCAERLGIDCEPVLRWQTSDCKLQTNSRAHCHDEGEYYPPYANFPRGTICLSRKLIPRLTIKQWHYTIAHEVAHLAVKSNHKTATFARRMVALGVANYYDRDAIKREKHIRKQKKQ